MSRLLAAVLASGLCGAAVAAPVPELKPHPSEPYWLKIYSTAPYREFWTGELVVADLDKALPKVVEAVEKEGGKLTQPLANFVSSRGAGTQQAAFDLPRQSGKSLLKRLRKLGAIADPAVRVDGAPIPLGEVRAKISALMKERTDRAAALAQVPAAAALSEELLEHLLLVEAVAARSGDQVRFNLLVRRK